MPCIAVERLAKTAIKTAYNGGDGMTILENGQCLGEDWAMVNSIS